MTSANRGDSWSSTDQSWHFPILRPFVRNRLRTTVQEHPKNGRPRKTRPKSSRSRRSRKTVMPTGRHHLGHGTNQWPGHLHLGNNGVRTKRVSVLVGKHQLIGTAQIKRVSVLNGDYRVPGSHRSHDREVEYLTYENIKGHP